MFVAFVLYTSYNGFENKIFVPKRVVHTETEGEGEDAYTYETSRRTAFETLEQAQTALTEATNQPFSKSILKNGYTAVIVDLASGQVVSNTTVAAVPQTESASVQQAD